MKYRPERAICMAITFASFEEFHKGCIPMPYYMVFVLASNFMMVGVDKEVEYMRKSIVHDIADSSEYSRKNMLNEYTRFIRIMDNSVPYKELKQIRYEFEAYYSNWDEYFDHNWDGYDWRACSAKEDKKNVDD